MAQKVIITTGQSLEPDKVTALKTKVATHLGLPLESVLVINARCLNVFEVAATPNKAAAPQGPPKPIAAVEVKQDDKQKVTSALRP